MTAINPRECSHPYCGFCGNSLPHIANLEADRARYKAALEFLADRENWAGDPLELTAWLYGDFTPFEIAREALGGPDA